MFVNLNNTSTTSPEHKAADLWESSKYNLKYYHISIAVNLHFNLQTIIPTFQEKVLCKSL